MRFFPEKPKVLQQVKKFPTFFGTRMFITAFTSARHESLSQARSIHHPTSWRTILILSSHLCMGLPSGSFPSGFLLKSLHTPLFSSHTCHMPRPSHSRFDHPSNICWPVQIAKLLIVYFSPLPCYPVSLCTKCRPQHPTVQHCPPLIVRPHAVTEATVTWSLTTSLSGSPRSRCLSTFIKHESSMKI